MRKFKFSVSLFLFRLTQSWKKFLQAFWLVLNFFSLAFLCVAKFVLGENCKEIKEWKSFFVSCSLKQFSSSPQSSRKEKSLSSFADSFSLFVHFHTVHTHTHNLSSCSYSFIFSLPLSNNSKFSAQPATKRNYVL
jgi:hypothetical protein